MAQVVLSAVGTALGGPIGGLIGRTVGAFIDQAAINALTPPRQVGRRLDGLQLQSTAEGSPMACVFGRDRTAGTIIWAARFKERRVEQSGGGGKGGPSTFSYSYSLSFAVAICEGPIDGLGRVWADGQVMDMGGVTMRLHRGETDQTPDPLIEAIEGTAPAYRGVAYVVFEDLGLDAYGTRPPQLSFEVFRRPRPAGGARALEDRLSAINLIPGAGEFVLATTPVLRRDGLTRSTPENINNPEGRADLLVSLDQLESHLPNCRTVNLVVSWFGDDVRAGHCQIRPGVEQAAKATLPFAWSVAGVGREDARTISHIDGKPAFGGTPADQSVRDAIAELKRRGFRVFLYPFLLMDTAGFPWRGRIAPSDAAHANAEVGAFFGGEWGLSRMVTHYARLGAGAGVDGLILASELRGLTTARAADGSYPAVSALRILATECRTILGPECEIGYAADWSEYFGHRPKDGSGDVIFHLDPLWADEAVSFVGIDWYPPLADWREGQGGVDALAGFAGPHDPDYLAANVEGGEDHAWFYASVDDRAAQVRTPITDGAYREPWVFRPKALADWWSHAHHDRPGGVRSSLPTAWSPGMKPVRLIEFGCPAVDRGGNAPNLFIDSKSSESALPPFSTGVRDDLGQRRALEALLGHYADPAHNPASSAWEGRMLAPDGMAAWCWDARPFPDFPARQSVWADGANWTLGHWLNGRAGAAPLADLLAALLARGGIADADLSGASGLVSGYRVEGPASLAQALGPLATVFAFDMAERGGAVAVVSREGGVATTLTAADLALPDEAASSRTATRMVAIPPDTLRVRFVDEAAGYQTGTVQALSDTPTGGGSRDLDLPVVMGRADAQRVARRELDRLTRQRDSTVVHVSLAQALSAEPGDVVAFDDREGAFRVAQVDADEHPRLTLIPVEGPVALGTGGPEWRSAAAATVQGPPAFVMLDLPLLQGFEEDVRPLCAVAADPWRPFDVVAGPSASALAVRATASQPALIGETLSALAPGPLNRFDHATRLTVRIEGGRLDCVDRQALFNGANSLVVMADNGEWELVQFLTAELVTMETYCLSGLLRGQSGTDPAMRVGASTGARVVVLTRALVRGDVAQGERDLPLMWRAAPAGGPPGGLAMSEEAFTWTGMGYRPLSPVHLRRRTLADGSVMFGWTRRTRLHGDSWGAGDAPLGEEAERYRVRVMEGERVVREVEPTTACFAYSAADQAADFPSGVPATFDLEVRQGSAVFGWGAALRQHM